MMEERNASCSCWSCIELKGGGQVRMASSIIIAFLSTLVEVLLRRAGSLVSPAARPLAHRYTVDRDCASSNPGFRAAIANSYIRVLSPLHSALVPVQCQRAAYDQLKILPSGNNILVKSIQMHDDPVNGVDSTRFHPLKLIFPFCSARYAFKTK